MVLRIVVHLRDRERHLLHRRDHHLLPDIQQEKLLQILKAFGPSFQTSYAFGINPVDGRIAWSITWRESEHPEFPGTIEIGDVPDM